MLRAMRRIKLVRGQRETGVGDAYAGWSGKAPFRRLHLNTDIKEVRE